MRFRPPLCRRFSEAVLLPNCSQHVERNWNEVGSLFKTSASEFVAASSMMRQNSDRKKEEEDFMDAHEEDDFHESRQLASHTNKRPSVR